MEARRVPQGVVKSQPPLPAVPLLDRAVRTQRVVRPPALPQQQRSSFQIGRSATTRSVYTVTPARSSPRVPVPTVSSPMAKVVIPLTPSLTPSKGERAKPSSVQVPKTPLRSTPFQVQAPVRTVGTVPEGLSVRTGQSPRVSSVSRPSSNRSVPSSTVTPPSPRSVKLPESLTVNPVRAAAVKAIAPPSSRSRPSSTPSAPPTPQRARAVSGIERVRETEHRPPFSVRMEGRDRPVRVPPLLHGERPGRMSPRVPERIGVRTMESLKPYSVGAVRAIAVKPVSTVSAPTKTPPFNRMPYIPAQTLRVSQL